MQGVKVKNRAPAAIQITAEQLVREARERQEDGFRPPQQKVNDEEELRDFQASKRRDFEFLVGKNKHNLGWFLKYAKWEESQLEFRRVRSIYERAIEVDYKNPAVWLNYAQFEMRNKFVNHARNVWDRAVTLLPRATQLWYKYAYMEEMLGQIKNARTIFERWMQWEPEEQAWFSYIKLEERVGEIRRARDLYERFCACHIVSSAYIKYAKWEERHAQKALARNVFERALTELPENQRDEKLYVEFARFEERCKEPARCRAIYNLALDTLPKSQAKQLYRAFVTFEKQHGSQQTAENAIAAKRRARYEEQVSSDPMQYDSWFDYIRLEESETLEAIHEAKRLRDVQVDASKKMGTSSAVLHAKWSVLNDPNVVAAIDQTRKVYERAVANAPSDLDKSYWKRYIYLWVNRALFEEMIAKDVKATREVYKSCLRLIPHKHFSFSKIWIMFAHFEVRQHDVGAARKVLGQAIGRAPKDKVFRSYIQLELQLGNVDRCRTLYEKFLEFSPENSTTWIKFAELEHFVEEDERARAIFELAISQPILDMPETVWKKYIEFEIAVTESSVEPGKAAEVKYDKAMELYERLLEKVKHVKVWISFARFYGITCGMVDEARSTFENGYQYLKKAEEGVASGMKEERVLLLEAWRDMEEKLVDSVPESWVSKVQAMVPHKIKKKRPIVAEDGSTAGWEEYYDYVFPDDPKQATGLKILEMAKKWKSAGGKLGGNLSALQNPKSSLEGKGSDASMMPPPRSFEHVSAQPEAKRLKMSETDTADENEIDIE